MGSIHGEVGPRDVLQKMPNQDGSVNVGMAANSSGLNQIPQNVSILFFFSLFNLFLELNDAKLTNKYLKHEFFQHYCINGIYEPIVAIKFIICNIFVFLF